MMQSKQPKDYRDPPPTTPNHRVGWTIAVGKRNDLDGFAQLFFEDARKMRRHCMRCATLDGCTREQRGAPHDKLYKKQRGVRGGLLGAGNKKKFKGGEQEAIQTMTQNRSRHCCKTRGPNGINYVLTHTRSSASPRRSTIGATSSKQASLGKEVELDLVAHIAEGHALDVLGSEAS